MRNAGRQLESEKLQEASTESKPCTVGKLKLNGKAEFSLGCCFGSKTLIVRVTPQGSPEIMGRNWFKVLGAKSSILKAVFASRKFLRQKPIGTVPLKAIFSKG